MLRPSSHGRLGAAITKGALPVMQRSVPLLILAAAAVILAGCDNKKPNNGSSHVEALTTKVDMGNGQSATIGSKLPNGIPAYAKVYPGANVMSVMKMPAAGGMPASVMIMFTVPDKADAVLAFYKKLGADAGFDVTFDKKVGPTHVFKAQAKQGDNYVSVNVTESDGLVSINESYN